MLYYYKMSCNKYQYSNSLNLIRIYYYLGKLWLYLQDNYLYNIQSWIGNNHFDNLIRHILLCLCDNNIGLIDKKVCYLNKLLNYLKSRYAKHLKNIYIVNENIQLFLKIDKYICIFHWIHHKSLLLFLKSC